MRLRKKPSKPKLERLEVYLPLYSTVEDILSTIERELDEPFSRKKHGHIVVTYNYYAESLEIELQETETSAQYLQRLEEYNRKLEAYNEWYEENKEEIHAELERRAEIQREKKRREVERLERKLQRMKEKL